MKKIGIILSIILGLLVVDSRLIAEKKKEESKERIEIKETFSTLIYTCPMHPEVQQEKPGKCPKCNMKLEEKQVLMTYACPEKDCEYQKASPGECPEHKKELVKSEIKFFCPKCGAQVNPKDLKQKLVKPLKTEIPKDEKPILRNVRSDEIGKEAICVVMNKKFKIIEKTKVAVYKGKEYYLCCLGCNDAFVKNPEKFIR